MGELLVDSTYKLVLTGALENTSAVLVMGAAIASAPFKGGTLVPSPDALVFGWSTGPTGGFQLQALWPAGVPPGSQLALQFWVIDPGGPAGYSASNGLAITAP